MNVADMSPAEITEKVNSGEIPSVKCASFTEYIRYVER